MFSSSFVVVLVLGIVILKVPIPKQAALIESTFESPQLGLALSFVFVLSVVRDVNTTFHCICFFPFIRQ